MVIPSTAATASRVPSKGGGGCNLPVSHREDYSIYFISAIV